MSEFTVACWRFIRHRVQAMMHRSVLALFVSLAVIGGAEAGATGEAQDRSRFTSEEREALEAGRLVTRRRTEVRNGLVHFGGTSYQTIDRPIEEVWRAVRDPSNYRSLLPQVESVRTVSRGDREAVVRLEHTYSVVHASYHLRVRFDESRHDISFELDPRRPNDVRAARGFCTLQRWPGDRLRTLVSWGILAAIDDGIVGGLVRGQLHDWMLRVPSTMRSYLQGAGRAMFLAEL